MKLRRGVVWTAVAVIVWSVVEGSILLKRSMIRPRLPEPCFSCKAEDRPFTYPLISYFAKLKDMLVRGINVLVEHAKHDKLK